MIALSERRWRRLRVDRGGQERRPGHRLLLQWLRCLLHRKVHLGPSDHHRLSVESLLLVVLLKAGIFLHKVVDVVLQAVFGMLLLGSRPALRATHAVAGRRVTFVLDCAGRLASIGDEFGRLVALVSGFELKWITAAKDQFLRFVCHLLDACDGADRLLWPHRCKVLLLFWSISVILLAII